MLVQLYDTFGQLTRHACKPTKQRKEPEKLTREQNFQRLQTY